MATADEILDALAHMEERLLQRMDEWSRDLQLHLDGHFDALHRRLDRLQQGTRRSGGLGPASRRTSGP